MKLGIKHRIYEYLREWYEIDPTKFVNGGEIERLALESGYKASNASRRLRELETEEKIENRRNHKGHVEYRYLPDSDGVVRVLREVEKMHQVDPQLALI